MSKSFLLFICLFVHLVSYSQNDQSNQEKYWKYRENLKNKFLKIGPLRGESIPMACRIPGYAYGGTMDPTGTQLQWKDATITLGYYLIVLATECKLLANAGEPVQATLNELYYALGAINRLDVAAEEYLSEGDVPSALNGFLLRDDVPYTFWQNWENDGPLYPELMNDPGNPNRSDSDFNGLNDTNGLQLTTANQGNAESLDQIKSLLTGLVSVWELVGNVVVQPTPDDQPVNIRTEARAIALRIIHYVMTDENEGEFSPIFKILNQDGELVSRGPDCTGAAWPFVQIALRLDDPYVDEHLTQMLAQTEIPIMVSSTDLYFAILYSNAPCMEGLRQHLLDNYFTTPEDEPITIAHVPMAAILDIIYRIEDEEMDLSVGSTDGCTHITFSDIQLAIQLDLELPGLCEDLVYDQFLDAFLTAIAPLGISSNEILGRTIEMLLDDDWWQIGDEVCIPSESLNHDNVHIILELMTSSALWTDYDYVFSIADSDFPEIADNDFPYIGLLYPVLNNDGQPYNSTNRLWYQSLLNGAPCEGPWQDPLILENHAPNYWASACNLFKGMSETGPTTGSGNDEVPWKEYSGYYPGIDYMVMHNLYYLLWQNQLPFYTRNVECDCIVETTTEELINDVHVVRRQFESYKAMGIPSEAFLAHDLIVESANGLMDVKNDLIICSPDDQTSTTLTLRDGASLRLYEGNTLTVRAGNKVVVENGSSLIGGISYDNCCGGDAKIVLEENAELHIRNSNLSFYAGLELIMAEGSKLIVNDESLVQFTPAAHGSLVNCTSCEWTIENSVFNVSESLGYVNFHFYQGASISLLNSLLDMEASRLYMSEDVVMDAVESSLAFDEGMIINEFNGRISLTSSELEFNAGQLEMADMGLFQQIESSLLLSNGSLFLLHNPDIMLASPSTYEYRGGEVQLLGETTQILFGHRAVLDIGPDLEFKPTHPGGQHGFIEFRGSDDHELITGEGSVFHLAGDGSDKLMLRITDYADLWNANFGMGTIWLEDCMVDLSNHGRIWTDMKFRAHHVRFEDSELTDEEGGNIQVWYSSTAYFFDCDLVGVRVKNQGTISFFQQSRFLTPQSGFRAFQGSYIFKYCTFDGCHLWSQSLSALSRIENSEFVGASNMNNPQVAAVYDESAVELMIAKSEVRQCHEGVVKFGGRLSLRCNLFESIDHDAVAVRSAVLNMSSNSSAGYNNFHEVGTCIALSNAESLDLYNGYNDLSGYSDYCIVGTVNLKCKGPCDLYQNALHNYWGSASGNSYPPVPEPVGAYDPSMPQVIIELYSVGGPAPCYYEPGWGNRCRINLEDTDPSLSSACGTALPVIRKSMKLPEGSSGELSKVTSGQGNFVPGFKNLEDDPGNPLIYSDSFDGVSLDSALTYAVSRMEMFDSLASDTEASGLFHQVLTSGLDRSNSDIRWKMEWGRYHMKNAIESMFLHGELVAALNHESFETPVQQYVDVLNTMTDTLLSDSTYKQQFYLEIDKGQLFRTLGRPELARYIYQHLDDCQLDSLEQAVLNNWLKEVDVEMNLYSQYMEDDLTPEEIIFSADTSAYNLPVEFTPSQFYFGLWIQSPNQLLFANCSDQMMWRTLQVQTSDLRVFPNPSAGDIQLSSDREGYYSCQFFDPAGRIVYACDLNFTSALGYTCALSLPQTVRSGRYFFVLENESGIMVDSVVIQR